MLFRSPEKQKQQQDVLLRWTQRLIDSKLAVILEQKPLAQTARLISQGYLPKRAYLKAPVKLPATVELMTSKFLRELNIVQYRKFPLPSQFQKKFGTVNLIFGPNGVGKTSMLEAIEYFYSGANARVASPKNAIVRAQFDSYSDFLETAETTKSAELRRRNFDWYGQRDLKYSTLANSFARFNFLSTDEAALLASAPNINLEEMLSRVVAGPQAADLWTHMQKLMQPLDREIVRISGAVRAARSNQKRLHEQLVAAEAVLKQSDSEFSSLVEDLRRLQWITTPTKETVAKDLTPRLTTLLSMVREYLAGAANQSAEIPTLRSMAADIEKSEKMVKEADTELEKLQASKGRLLIANQKLYSQQEKQRQLSKVRWLIGADAFKLLKQAEDGKHLRENLGRLLASSSSPIELPSTIIAFDTPLAEVLDFYAKEKNAAINEAHKLDDEIRRKSRKQVASRKLIVEIRTLARQCWITMNIAQNAPCVTQNSNQRNFAS